MGHNVKLVFLRSTSSAKYLESELKSVDFEIFADAAYRPNPVYSKITGMFMPDREGEGTLDYNLIKKFSNSIRKEDADLIICHDQWAGLSGFRIKKRLGIPYLVLDVLLRKTNLTLCPISVRVFASLIAIFWAPAVHKILTRIMIFIAFPHLFYF